MQDKRRKLPISHWSRYLKLFLRYGSVKKYVNCCVAFLNYLIGKSRIGTMPALLKCEISRECFVFCKYCTAKKESVFYPFTLYKDLIDKVKDYIFLVSLYDIGEPLLNERLIEYIQYAHSRNIGTIISTSLSVNKPDDFWRDLVLSALDYIIIAIDGVSEGVYKKYRTQGDINLVFANLRKLVYYKSALHSKLNIEWQMLDLPWNKAEQSLASKMAKDMGCDKFRIIDEAVQIRKKYKEENIIRKRNCLLPYLIFIVNAYNQVNPCYKIYNSEMTVGNLNDNNFEEIWNNGEMANIRDKKRIIKRVHCNNCQE
ncbi:MAG: radical SAM/SPASM domain-containing protein [Desulfobaccales bacterium]